MAVWDFQQSMSLSPLGASCKIPHTTPEARLSRGFSNNQVELSFLETWYWTYFILCPWGMCVLCSPVQVHPWAVQHPSYFVKLSPGFSSVTLLCFSVAIICCPRHQMGHKQNTYPLHKHSKKDKTNFRATQMAVVNLFSGFFFFLEKDAFR